jgi:lipoprotein-anchoring transpeptidase ErfK/SrfK
MLPIYFAARSDDWRCTQLLLGNGPSPEELRVEISLALQEAVVIKRGERVFSTECSTGRDGFATPSGRYVITDKQREHQSTIYKVPMPFFMRLSCRDFGMHAGVVPNYPASHGCIRLPSAAARKLFAEIPVGTLVTIN